MEFLIYLDVCCLNRPFDDQTQERIFLEAEAVRLILARCQSGEWQLLGSEVIDDELEQTPDGERKRQMMAWAALASTKIMAKEQVKSRAREVVALGLKTFDASHIACAEVGNADIFLTTDDRMLRLGAKYSAMLQVRVENPLRWVSEVINARRD
ncbi:PIN domain-containing protein [Nostoc flagelliforme FACHB-838]|uniref:PIN domain-containing protein n=1 Tax=Nostoc flagelliforme FACHB-838 TaxID=2692904 RepID=A0ABR8DK35_9NOSO|nr:PIN domain-containing protein [Nostoc flagelliforme]MBD2529092.1 PIN domain-containing protein [Nostoc flagelliforme FACHB-838]